MTFPKFGTQNDICNNPKATDISQIFRKAGTRPLNLECSGRAGIVAVLQHEFLNYFTGKTTKMHFAIKVNPFITNVTVIAAQCMNMFNKHSRKKKNKIQ